MVAAQKAESEYETDHSPYTEVKMISAMAEGVDGNKVEYDQDPELQNWFASKTQNKVDSILSLVGKAVKPKETDSGAPKTSCNKGNSQ